MAQVSEDQVLDALKRVTDTDKGRDVVSLGMISGLVIKDGNVGFALEVDPADGERKDPLRKACEQAVEALPGALSVTVVLTAHREAKEASPPPAPTASPPPATTAPATDKPLVPGVRSIIAIASGKGGVGKSTTAVNLALAMAADGRKVGVLDSDIYGPSMPRMLGISGRPSSPDGKMLKPMENYGVKCMSMGFLVDEDTPMIWRGPMVMSAIEQMLRDVEWGELDVLVVDMPPGTGDAQLTLAQKVPLTGAVIVSTPQDIALLDARRGLNMFRKVDVPVFGIVENMSYYICTECGHRAEIFSHGGARRIAEQLGMEFLGEVPLDIEIRETSDSGQPIVVSRPESEQAQTYRRIAERVTARIDAALGEGARKAPKIVIQ
ncbi:MAG: iron-sulfur cluster carrier protein ApbC [Proteobacteria bacterium]|nr:iron-sulfur cluster carrier protein ApbC [Pseudomonadota bacterium]